jgi:hypothetical protein
VFPYGFSGYEGKTEQILMDTDLFGINPVLPEPMAVKRGMINRILHRVPDTFIDKAVEIAALHRLNFRGEAGSSRHTRELLEELFIDYSRSI